MVVVLYLSEILYSKLYFGTISGNGFNMKQDKERLHVSFDDLRYPNIISYFGPPSLGTIYKYCEKLNMIRNTNKNYKIIHCTSIKDDTKRTNAAFLIAAYSIIYLKKSPKEAYKCLQGGNQPEYLPFCDTTNNKNASIIKMESFLEALYKSIFIFRFISFKNFDLYEYERLSNINGGWMNWILPNKLIAFQGPVEQVQLNKCALQIEYFKENNVVIVIRLNYPMYNANHFRSVGIAHYDLYFTDGSPPTKSIVKKFLAIVENESGAIAIHCKAGLGRSGTLIAAYIIKHYDYTALQAISWVRLCRPGSVIGVQQDFLEKHEEWLKIQGRLFRRIHNCSFPYKFKFGLYSLEEKYKSAIT